ncbi:hypothetical protein FHR70_003702 [Microvirga lupini]|uniref:Uncharacterized protein n=1 Tax=Microvirga lupini TaxID=420324 RepID=A0A7W4YY07_9HYPH|nr:hypothetical protein [Microvirga lupini]MBB3020616.1 hypothetical protein [Microvirga lupini]
MNEDEIQRVAQAINEQYQGQTIPPDELREMAIAAIKAIRSLPENDLSRGANGDGGHPSLSLEGERG